MKGVVQLNRSAQVSAFLVSFPRTCTPLHFRERERERESKMEVERVRLLSLALEFGFDEEFANQCLDRLIDLYGTTSLETLVS